MSNLLINSKARCLFVASLRLDVSQWLQYHLRPYQLILMQKNSIRLQRLLQIE